MKFLMITARGQAVRCPVLNIRETNRGSKGVKLVNLDKKDQLTGVSEVIELDEENTPDINAVLALDDEKSEDTGDTEVVTETRLD